MLTSCQIFPTLPEIEPSAHAWSRAPDEMSHTNTQGLAKMIVTRLQALTSPVELAITSEKSATSSVLSIIEFLLRRVVSFDDRVPVLPSSGQVLPHSCSSKSCTISTLGFSKDC